MPNCTIYALITAAAAAGIVAQNTMMRPPKPQFNVNDNDECHRVIDDYFQTATRGWERDKRDKQEMQSLLWNILDKRQEYGEQIAGNPDVCNWI